MITISKRAAERVRVSARQSASEGLALRIAAKRTADGSIEYAMGFDEPATIDSRTTSEGIDVVIAPTSIDLLNGVVLDYVEMETGEFHFIFKNPNDPAYVPPTEE